jgi:hypothetical protein
MSDDGAVDAPATAAAAAGGACACVRICVLRNNACVKKEFFYGLRIGAGGLSGLVMLEGASTLVIAPAPRGARGASSHGASAAATGRASAVRRIHEEDAKQDAASSARVVNASGFAEGLEGGLAPPPHKRPRRAGEADAGAHGKCLVCHVKKARCKCVAVLLRSFVHIVHIIPSCPVVCCHLVLFAYLRLQSHCRCPKVEE